MALPFPPLQVPEHQEERGDQQRNQEERDRRAPAQVSGLDTDLVREDRQDLARVTGAALGQKVHDAQVGQCEEDRKSTRLNSSHTVISYAVFCLKKKNSEQLLAYATNLREGP